MAVRNDGARHWQQRVDVEAAGLAIEPGGRCFEPRLRPWGRHQLQVSAFREFRYKRYSAKTKPFGPPRGWPGRARPRTNMKRPVLIVSFMAGLRAGHPREIAAQRSTEGVRRMG